MKISKHLHSCILVRQSDITYLIDPGVFTYTQKALYLGDLPKLDYILITHSHPDHVYPPFVAEIRARFPAVMIIGNSSVVRLLAKEQIYAQSEPAGDITMTGAPHEKLWDGPVPQNSVFTVADRLTHPGDSLHLAKTGDILCLPVTAPWGSTTDAVLKAVKLKPRFIIPVHDWMWREDFRRTMYDRLTAYFIDLGIQFFGLETGQEIDV
jgi:L-ascorbate metabolism protein UlaG (beta-lactamase superfamily)